MSLIDFNAPDAFDKATAIDIIKRSALMHPSLFIDAIKSRADEDARYAVGQENTAVRRSVMASHNAAMRALAIVQSDALAMFADDMGAGIIALNIACKLQLIPAHVRTSIAVRTWENADA